MKYNVDWVFKTNTYYSINDIVFLRITWVMNDDRNSDLQVVVFCYTNGNGFFIKYLSTTGTRSKGSRNNYYSLVLLKAVLLG